MQDAGITVELKNQAPVELADYSQSLLCFANEFRRQVHSDPEIFTLDVRLYVTEVKTGSLIALLTAMAPQVLQFVSYADSVIDFAQHLVKAFAYLSGESAEKPALDKAGYQNLSSIVEPVAKDRGAQLNIATLNVNGSVTISLDSQKANAVQNAIRREINLLETPATGLHEKVLLYWYQARGDLKSRTGDRAIIESISSSSVKTICANEMIKSEMILNNENPFKEAFIVDVIVETIKGKPALYKVVALHDKLDHPA